MQSKGRFHRRNRATISSHTVGCVPPPLSVRRGPHCEGGVGGGWRQRVEVPRCEPQRRGRVLLGVSSIHAVVVAPPAASVVTAGRRVEGVAPSRGGLVCHAGVGALTCPLAARLVASTRRGASIPHEDRPRCLRSRDERPVDQAQRPDRAAGRADPRRGRRLRLLRQDRDHRRHAGADHARAGPARGRVVAGDLPPQAGDGRRQDPPARRLRASRDAPRAAEDARGRDRRGQPLRHAQTSRPSMAGTARSTSSGARSPPSSARASSSRPSGPPAPRRRTRATGSSCSTATGRS